MSQRVDGGGRSFPLSEHARGRAAPAAPARAAEVRRSAFEAASSLFAKAAAERSQFERMAPGGPRLDATAPASSLLTEDTNDEAVNCLDLAADWVDTATPALRGRSELIFLDDTRAGTEGDSGHVVIRQGQRVFDPSSGRSYEDMNAFLAERPEYRQVGTLRATDAAKIFAAEPGSPERVEALAQAKVSPELRQMMVADIVNDGGVTDLVHAEPYETTYPLQAGPVTVELSSTLDKSVERKDGYVTMTVEAETEGSVSASFELSKVKVKGKPDVNAEVGVSSGETVTYQVTMKEDDYQRLRRGELPPPHPLDPSTLPDGASVQLEQSQFKGTSMGAGLSYYGVELGISDEVKSGEGISLDVRREGDTVTVTAGPTEFVEAGGRVSLGVGVGPFSASVSVGKSESLNEYSLRTAQFDLSTDGGKRAFDEFRETGRLPEQEGEGVSNTLRFNRVTYSGEQSFGADAGSKSAKHVIRDVNGQMLTVDHPDGSKSERIEMDNGDASPDLVVERRIDKDGNLVPGSEKFALTFHTTDDNERRMLVTAFTGDPAKAEAAAAHDEPITLHLTPEQMKAIGERENENPSAERLFDESYRDVEPRETIHALADLTEAKLAAHCRAMSLGESRHDIRPLPGELVIGGEPV